ncbi:ParA family protein, partial [Pasteurellaceae bacterium UScroc12]
PNVGGLNEIILMSSDYFIVPTSPDFFCWQAVGSLSKNIKKWHGELKFFKENNGFIDINYAIKNNPKFIGTVQQRYRPRNGSPAKSFEKWIDRIKSEVTSSFVPMLKNIGCVIDEDKIKNILLSEGAELKPYDLAHIADFNSLIAISQEYRVPIFSLTKAQIKDAGQFGHALETMDQSKDKFELEFNALADRVIKLTS